MKAQSVVTVYGGDHASTAVKESLADVPLDHEDHEIVGLFTVDGVSVLPAASDVAPVPEGQGRPMLTSGIQSVPRGSVSPDDGRLSAGAVAGLVIAALVAVAIMLITVCRHKRRGRGQDRNRNNDEMESKGTDIEDSDHWDDPDIPLIIHGPNTRMEVNEEGDLTMISEDDCGEVEVSSSRSRANNTSGRLPATGRGGSAGHCSLFDEVRSFALIAGSVDDKGQEEFEVQAPRGRDP